MKTAPDGFTLVELAIVITIIGLLIGGVLKGQQMMDNARITDVTRQITAYHTAVTTFKDIYKNLPGDLPSPGNFLPNCTTAECMVNGDANGKIDNTAELLTFWLHLSKANLIKGVDERVTDWKVIPPNTALGGKLFMLYNQYYLYSIVTDCCGNETHALNAHQAWQIDLKLDDGKPLTGEILGIGDNSNCGLGASNNNYHINIAGNICGISTPLKS